ncbi:MAG: hypothetical protein DHS20C15_34040 [Planctomycetota bacterium]|nr:MAG: hypothetical protein DHS20C15_34040 [Planctomycetota bacterium]
MCTVSFLVLPDGGYLLATNRDESPRRGLAQAPSLRTLPPQGELASPSTDTPLSADTPPSMDTPPSVDAAPLPRVLAPTDADAGGTWIAVDESGRCLCVLNGDRPPARVAPDDAPSRGQLVLELMRAPDAESVFAELQARAASGALREKAFKLLVARRGDSSRPADVERIEWDGAQLVRSRHSGDGVFVSSRIEPDAVAAARGALFATLSSAPHADAQALAAAQLRWHASHRHEAPRGDGFSVCMHRDEARSVSLTQVRARPDAVSMHYLAGQPCEASVRDLHSVSFSDARPAPRPAASRCSSPR